MRIEIDKKIKGRKTQNDCLVQEIERLLITTGGRYSEMFFTWHLNNMWNLLLEVVIQVKNLAKCRAGFTHLAMDGNF